MRHRLLLSIAIAALLAIGASAAKYVHERSDGEACGPKDQPGFSPTAPCVIALSRDDLQAWWIRERARSTFTSQRQQLAQLERCQSFGDVEASDTSSCGNDLLAELDAAGIDWRHRSFVRSKFRANGNGAILLHSNLSYARFDDSDLTAANFGDSIFYGAAFNKCRLVRAKFANADLRDVAIVRSDITGADFSGANLNGAVWDPTPGTLPDIASLASAVNLQGLRYGESPRQLIELREALYKAGLLGQAREVTYAIERTRRVLDQGAHDPIRRLAGWVRFLAFEKTVGYGIYPLRPLLLVALLIPVFAPLYFRFDRPRSGLAAFGWPSTLAATLHAAISAYLLALTVLCLTDRPFG